MVTQRAMTAAARPHGFISSGIGWIVSIDFTSVGRSYLNGLLEFSVGGQIALRHNKMVGGSRIEVETIGDPFLRGYCGVRNGCVARSWWVFLDSGCLGLTPYSVAPSPSSPSWPPRPHCQIASFLSLAHCPSPVTFDLNNPRDVNSLRVHCVIIDAVVFLAHLFVSYTFFSFQASMAMND